MRALWLSALAAFAADQISKVVVVHWLDLKRIGAMDVVPPILNFRMGWNTGINFGLGAGGPEAARWLLIALAVGISAWLLAWARDLGRAGRIGAGLVIGGATANVLDRLVYGAVADFLNVSCCGIDNPFAFNLADVFIFAGAGVLIVWGERRDADARVR